MHQKTLFFTLFLAFMPMVLLAEPPQSSEKATKYVVKSGDCLWNISRDVLNDPLKWPVIYKANEGRIRNPNLIYPGQKFAIPPPSSITKAGLRAATRLAYARMEPISSRTARAKPAPMAVDRAAPAMTSKSPPEKVMAADSEKGAEKAVSPPSTEEEKPAVPAASSSGGPVGLIIGVVLVVLAGGFFIWRKMAAMPEENQEPRPLSSFPEVRNVTPMPDQPQVKKEETTEAPMRSGYITSMSIPSEPAASQPGTQTPPATQAPSGSPAPGTPQAPVTPPAQPTGQETPVDKPGDNTPPPSSTHAA